MSLFEERRGARLQIRRGHWRRGRRHRAWISILAVSVLVLEIAGCADTPTPAQPPVLAQTPAPARTPPPGPTPEPARDDQPIPPSQIEGGRIGMVDAVNLIIQRHPDLIQASAALARSKADVGTARSVWLPQVSYQAGLGPNTFGGNQNTGLNNNVQGPGVQLNQQVWDFGRSAKAIDSATATESQRGFEVVVTADKLAEKGALAFLDVKRYEALAVAATKNTAALKHLRDRIQERVLAGASDASDLTLADVRLESARGEEIRAKSSFMAVRALLATLIGRMPDQFSDPTPVIDKLPLHDREPVFEQLPAVAAANQAEKAAAAKIDQTKAEIFPRLGVQLGYNRSNYTYTTITDYYTALFTINGNLYHPGHKHAVHAAEEDRRAAQAAKDSAILDIRGRALSAKENLIGGQMRIAVYRRQEQNAVAASQIFFEAYTLGKRTLTELLNTQVEIYQAANSRITAEYDVMAARIQYQNVYGNLRQSLGVTATLRGE